MTDPRLLHVHSEHGYTSNPGDALPDEPEAVSEAEQRYITRMAQRSARARDRRTFDAAIEWMNETLTELRRLDVGVDINGDLRGLQHRVDKLGRRVHHGR